MAERLSRQVTKVGDVHVVVLRGEVDSETAKGLSDWLVEIAGSPVVIDLSELAFIDSSGVATLMIIAKSQMTANDNELILTRPHPIVRRVLEIVGMSGWVRDWDPKWDADS